MREKVEWSKQAQSQVDSFWAPRHKAKEKPFKCKQEIAELLHKSW